MRVALTGALIIGCAFAAGTALCQDKTESFPKNIKLLISSKEGGGYTVYGRLMERHMPRFLPGKPDIILQSMFGAGGVRLVNYMYNVAPRDGAALGLIQSTTTLAPIQGSSEARFDPRKLSWIGSMNETSAFCLSWHNAPIKTWQDMKDNEFLVGATGANSRGATWPAMINRIFGTKMKVISGYAGGNEVLIAMERGEIHGRCGTLLAGVRATRPDWLDQKLLVAPITISRERHPQFPETPSIAEFSGDRDEHARNILEVVFKILEIDRPFVAPPDLTSDRLATLRTAFESMMKDASFLEEGQRLNLEFVYGSGERVARAIDWIYTMPKDVVMEAGGED